MEKQLLIITSIWIFIWSVSRGQNLVPNPSFEDTIGCPQSLYSLHKAKFWSPFRASPDYFHRCAPFDSSVPANSVGYQEPSKITENAYAGIITYLDFLEYREFFGAQLKQPLVIGNNYFVSMKISLANSSNWASDHIGIKFSTNAYSDSGNLSPYPQSIDNYAQVYSRSIIIDTFNWNTITGSFIADSAYQFISIGNFFSDSLTNRIHIGNLNGAAYYFIDEICVSTDSLLCEVSAKISSIKKTMSVKFYPNPVGDFLNIISPYPLDALTIYDVMGREVNSISTKTGKLKVDVSNISIGIYLFRIQAKNEFQVEKILIQR